MPLRNWCHWWSTNVKYSIQDSKNHHHHFIQSYLKSYIDKFKIDSQNIYTLLWDSKHKISSIDCFACCCWIYIEAKWKGLIWSQLIKFWKNWRKKLPLLPLPCTIIIGRDTLKVYSSFPWNLIEWELLNK